MRMTDLQKYIYERAKMGYKLWIGCGRNCRTLYGKRTNIGLLFKMKMVKGSKVVELGEQFRPLNINMKKVKFITDDENKHPLDQDIRDIYKVLPS